MTCAPVQTPAESPDIVRRAEALCRRLGFASSCRPETGRLLQVLAASVVTGTILELGTGGGYGTAWLASGLRRADDARLVTIDLDQNLTAHVARLFDDWPAVDVLVGDWRDALERGPLALIFVDASDAKSTGIDEIVSALEPGGSVVLDDLTPLELWPDAWRGKSDPIRAAWLNHPGLTSTEIRVAADHAAILGVKR